jgi:hypothetical protein
VLKTVECKIDEDVGKKETIEKLDRLLMRHQKDFSAIKEITKSIEY